MRHYHNQVRLVGAVTWAKISMPCFSAVIFILRASTVCRNTNLYFPIFWVSSTQTDGGKGIDQIGIWQVRFTQRPCWFCYLLLPKPLVPWRDMVIVKMIKKKLIVSVLPRGVLDSPSCFPIALCLKLSSPLCTLPTNTTLGWGHLAGGLAVQWSVEDAAVVDAGLMMQALGHIRLFTAIQWDLLLCFVLFFCTERVCTGAFCGRRLYWQGSLYDLIFSATFPLFFFQALECFSKGSLTVMAGI